MSAWRKSWIPLCLTLSALLSGCVFESLEQEFEVTVPESGFVLIEVETYEQANHFAFSGIAEQGRYSLLFSPRLPETRAFAGLGSTSICPPVELARCSPLTSFGDCLEQPSCQRVEGAGYWVDSAGPVEGEVVVKPCFGDGSVGDTSDAGRSTYYLVHVVDERPADASCPSAQLSLLVRSRDSEEGASAVRLRQIL